MATTEARAGGVDVNGKHLGYLFCSLCISGGVESQPTTDVW